MPLGGISVSWNGAVPSVTSQAGVGYQDLQSIKTTLQQVMDSEHVFESTGGSTTGIHRKGSAVVFYGASSAISSTDTNGRLMIDSTNSRLHQAGSTNTMVLGGQYVTFGAGLKSPDAPSTVYMSSLTQMFAMEVSHGTILNGSTSTTITLNNSWVRAMAFVQAYSPTNSGVGSWVGGVPYVTATGIVGTNQLEVINASGATVRTPASSATTYGVQVLVVGIKAL